jgi:CheY-like chemotaxis protein
MEGKPIVVVEDEPDVLELLRDILEVEGFHVVGVASPDLVLPVLDSIHPAVFLIDLMLPRMSGIELAQMLREKGQATTPMLAMSASRLMLEIAQNSGLFQETISKPFDLSTVLTCIERYISRGAINGSAR